MAWPILLYFRKADITAITESVIASSSGCDTHPIAVKDAAPLEADLANLKAALGQVQAVEGFMTAASPGLVPVFQTNRHYPSHEAYVEEYRKMLDVVRNQAVR